MYEDLKTLTSSFTPAALLWLVIILQAIEQEIEKLCPSSISSLCDSIIGTEGSKLLDWVAKELDPTTVCSAIDAC